MLFNYTNARLSKLAIHYIGNKGNEDNIFLSDSLVEDITQEMEAVLISYFLSGFKSEEIFSFWHESELELNNIYNFISDIFERKGDIVKKSQNIGKHLYEHSIHPNIKGGELYIATIKNCIFKDEQVEVIVLIKSENKENFIKSETDNGKYNLNLERGLSLSKVDKGCIIFNTEKNKGYNLLLINGSSQADAQYWKDNFLRVKQAENEYQYTVNFLNLTKQYVTNQLDTDFEVNKTDKIDFLNRSIEYFKEHDTFEKDEFEKEVFQDKAVIKSFNNFETEYSKDHDVKIIDHFEISPNALKKQVKSFKSVLKLDKNFHVYIHGNKNLIEKGFDRDSGMHYYKIFFKEEA